MADCNTPERAAARARSAWIRDEALGVVLKNIRARREQLGLTQRDVAAAAGWKQAFVAGVESGKKPTLSYGAVAVFAFTLDTNILDLGKPGRFGEPSPIKERARRKGRRADKAEATKKPAKKSVALRGEVTRSGAKRRSATRRSGR